MTMVVVVVVAGMILTHVGRQFLQTWNIFMYLEFRTPRRKHILTMILICLTLRQVPCTASGSRLSQAILLGYTCLFSLLYVLNALARRQSQFIVTACEWARLLGKCAVSRWLESCFLRPGSLSLCC